MSFIYLLIYPKTTYCVAMVWPECGRLQYTWLLCSWNTHSGRRTAWKTSNFTKHESSTIWIIIIKEDFRLLWERSTQWGGQTHLGGQVSFPEVALEEDWKMGSGFPGEWAKDSLPDEGAEQARDWRGRKLPNLKERKESSKLQERWEGKEMPVGVEGVGAPLMST